MSALEIIKRLNLNFKYHKIVFINPLFLEILINFHKDYSILQLNPIFHLSPTAGIKKEFIILNPTANCIF